MSRPIIIVKNLSKKYIIGENIHGRGARTFRDIFDRKLRNIFSRNSEQKREDTTIWALKNVSFEVQEGEVVGIIGRNGAGKSTLLKILSRITEPTEGQVTIRGRVASLLEVGTGFNAELTGRENIFLNGSILGMKKAEMKKKFDEIVAFSEVEKFIDTPVKRYSSGMYVRLAFAVAAHLEPEILLVDEVLAVGDVQFQKKCLGKMSAVAKEGRTVLFVSHNMPAITRLCKRAILLHMGGVVDDGEASKVVNVYLRSDIGTRAVQDWPELSMAPGDEFVRLRAVRVLNGDGVASETIDIRKRMIIEMEYVVLKGGLVCRPFYIIWNDDGVCVFATTGVDDPWIKRPREQGIFSSAVSIPGNLLAEGNFAVTAGLAAAGDVSNHFLINDAVAFQVVDSLEGDSARGNYGGTMPGIVRPKLLWNTNRLS